MVPANVEELNGCRLGIRSTGAIVRAGEVVKSRRSIVPLTLLLLSSCATDRAALGYVGGCGGAERAYFSCRIDAGKVAALCRAPGGPVLFRLTHSMRRDVVFEDGIDAEFHYNRFTRARATHEEVSFAAGDRQYTIFNYDDADFGPARAGISVLDSRRGSARPTETCIDAARSELHLLEGQLPCDHESALGCRQP